MIRIARLDENKKVVEILELENPRDSLHPDTLKLFVSATNAAEVGDYYENQQFVKKDAEEIEAMKSDEIKAIEEIEKKSSDAKARLQNLNIDSIQDELVKTTIEDILKYLNIF